MLISFFFPLGHEYCTYNIHKLLHIPHCILQHGPLRAYWLYPFERLNLWNAKAIHRKNAYGGLFSFVYFFPSVGVFFSFLPRYSQASVSLDALLLGAHISPPCWPYRGLHHPPAARGAIESLFYFLPPCGCAPSTATHLLQLHERVNSISASGTAQPFFSGAAARVLSQSEKAELGYFFTSQQMEAPKLYDTAAYPLSTVCKWRGLTYRARLPGASEQPHSGTAEQVARRDTTIVCSWDTDGPGSGRTKSFSQIRFFLPQFVHGMSEWNLAYVDWFTASSVRGCVRPKFHTAPLCQRFIDVSELRGKIMLLKKDVEFRVIDTNL